MGKHLFWGVVVFALALIAGYTSLVIAGYPEQASDLVGVSIMMAAIVGFAAVMFS